MNAPFHGTGLRSIDDIIEFEQVSLDKRDIPATTYEALIKGASIDPDAPAISFFADVSEMQRPVVWTHKAFMENVHRTANALRRLGIERDTVVAYVLPNLPETHLIIWGGCAAGQVLAINPMLEASQISELLRAAEVRVVVTLDEVSSPDIWTKTAEAVRGLKHLKHVLLCSLDTSNQAPGHDTFEASIANDVSRLAKAGLNVSHFWKEIEDAHSDTLEFEPPKSSDLSTLLCTGGTTGLPKIAKRTHQAETFTCWASAQFNPDLYVSRRASFCGLPLFHTNAILVSGLLPLMYGGHVVLGGVDGYRSEGILPNFWKIVERFGIAVFSGVPAIYNSLLQVPRQGEDISSLVCGVCGAAPMPVELFKSFEEASGIRIVEGYGMTEGTVTSSRNPLFTDTPNIGSVGLRIPYQDMRTAIMDDNGGFVRWAEPDEVGEICISGPNVFEGYIIEEQNAGIWFQQDGIRWFNSGDLARQDDKGYFWMTGRKKELIIRGGHNIDPKTIEEAMYSHAGVSMVAAVGRPDARVGEIPVLYYQSRDGKDIPIDDLARTARLQIPERAAVPKDFVRLGTLPLTSVGKINKLALNMIEIERVVRNEANECSAILNDLTVDLDPRRGVVAHVSVDSGEENLKQALGSYALNVDFEATR